MVLRSHQMEVVRVAFGSKAVTGREGRHGFCVVRQGCVVGLRKWRGAPSMNAWALRCSHFLPATRPLIRVY